MSHGAAPNGEAGATRVNHWTLIVDILVPNAKNEKWLALLQTDPLNTSDADLLVRFANGRGGIGTTGQYEGKGAMIPGQWHRLAFAVDANFSMLNKYIDGQLFAAQGLPAPALDGRHSLGPTSLLFADEDGESQPAYINSIQFRNYTMGEEEIAALGGPDASGIPAHSGP
jgi:hypothetical protein